MSDMTEEQFAEVSRAIAAGQKIEAIKMYREFTGVDLKAAKEFVEALDGSLQGGSPVRSGPVTGLSEFPEDEALAMTEAIFQGKKIDAIRIYRQHSGKGLKDSKAVIDDLERQLRQECPERFTGKSFSVGCGAVVLFGGMLGLLGWMLGRGA